MKVEVSELLKDDESIKKLIGELEKLNNLNDILRARNNYESKLASALKEKELDCEDVSKDKTISFFGDIKYRDKGTNYFLEIKKGALRLELYRLSKLYNKIKGGEKAKYVFVFISRNKGENYNKVYLVDVNSIFSTYNIDSDSEKEFILFNEKYMSNLPKKKGTKETKEIEFIVSVRKMDLEEMILN